ncbi:hypothetical protein LINPERHAP1_LOCUS22028, partial [Linum perenne]
YYYYYYHVQPVVTSFGKVLETKPNNKYNKHHHTTSKLPIAYNIEITPSQLKFRTNHRLSYSN